MKLLNWIFRRRLEHDLDRELEYHLERRTADLTASGLDQSAARARAAAELEAGARTREEVRDVWLGQWLRDFVYDFRYSLRTFRRNPSFTITALLSLGLGIGATTAIYSLVDQVILHALPVRDPGRLALVDWKGDQAAPGFGSYNLMSYPLCRALQQQTQVFDGVLCRAATSIVLSKGTGDPSSTPAELVSGSYFSVLGVGAALGRVIGPEDDAVPGASPVVMLSYDFWQAQFGGAPDVVGRKVLLNNRPMTIIGVAAANFRGVDVGEVPGLWIPAAMYEAAVPGSDNLFEVPVRWMQILARIGGNLNASQAQTALQPWFQKYLTENSQRPGFPALTAEQRSRYFRGVLRVTSSPQGHSVLRRNLAEPLWMLLAATGILLGLACLNVAGLFLARGAARGRELGTRLALGASSSRLGRQLLADSLLLGIAGGALGVVLAPLTMRVLIGFLPPGETTAIVSTVNLSLLGFAVLISVAAGLLTGLAPAIRAGRDSLASSLRDRTGASSGNVRLRKCIVTLQVAFSLILVIGASLFVRSLTGLLAKGPGFDTTSLVSFELKPRRSGYTTEQTSLLTRRIYDEVSALPITRASAVVSNGLLLGGSWNNIITIQSDHRIVTERDVNLNAATPGFYAAMGVPLLAGRDFDQSDARPQGQATRRTAIVNQAFVNRYLPNRSPLGVTIGIGGGPDVMPGIEIVGVVGDFSYRGLREDAEQVWFPIFAGEDTFGGTFYVRVRGTPERAFDLIRQVVAKAGPSIPVLRFQTLDEQVRRSLSTERILATLSSSFAGLALLLSLIGLYGVMSFVVTRRLREIGIRLALGATAWNTLRLILHDAGVMIASGVLVALPCVAALGKLVRSQLYGISDTDPLTIAGATLFLGAASMLAAIIPASRATRVNPADTLRLD